MYGSLGAAIALMFWLYIIAISVLIGAEYNAQRAAVRRGAPEPGELWKLLRRRLPQRKAEPDKMTD